MLVYDVLNTDYTLAIEQGVYTSHIKSEYYVSKERLLPLNEDNSLLGITLRKDEDDYFVEVSTFKNSYYTRSYSLGVGYRFLHHPLTEDLNLSFGLSGGVIKGYEDWQIPTNFYKDYSLYVAPYIKVNYNCVYVNLRLLGEAVSFSVGWDFKF